MGSKVKDTLDYAFCGSLTVFLMAVCTLVGIVGFAVRYISMFFDRFDPNGVDQKPYGYGWFSPHMRMELLRLFSSAERHSFWHLCKNLLVEYFEQGTSGKMELRRGIGFMSCLWLVTFCAFVISVAV